MANIYAINAETELDAALPDYLADHYADRRARLHGKVDRDIDSRIADMKSYLEFIAYMRPTQEAVERVLYTIEQGLNVAGYIPVVSNISGSIRIAFGLTEIIGGLAAGIFMTAKGLLTGKDRQEKLNHVKYTIEFIYLPSFCHGMTNYGRGLVEMVPLLGNLSTFLYDKSGYRLRYVSETNFYEKNLERSSIVSVQP